jgi:hypothetical protein
LGPWGDGEALAEAVEVAEDLGAVGGQDVDAAVELELATMVAESWGEAARWRWDSMLATRSLVWAKRMRLMRQLTSMSSWTSWTSDGEAGWW